MAFGSEPLDPLRHQLGGFDSGEPELDTWLREHAAGAGARRVARTFVSVEPETDPVRAVGYYSLAGHRLVRDELARSIGRGSPTEVPAVLLARLALHRTHHGRGDGGVLLADALARIVTATNIVAARFVVVDVVHERAADFYQHHGFRRVLASLRLVQKVSDIAAALGIE